MTKTTVPDLLRFIMPSTKPIVIGWEGVWPPPETMIVAIGNDTGRVSVFADDPVAIAQAKTVATVLRMKRTVYSKLDASTKNEHFTRAAEYLHAETV